MNIDLRPDLKLIATIITPSTKVLDIGCSSGELLEYLVKNKNVDGRGVEISQKNVSECVKKGLSVIQGDADSDLRFYPEKSFDFVISSQMLQATKHPKEVLEQMLRISKHAIVSIPNFGNWRPRSHLMLKGKMPVTKKLSYQWYETPNIHFCTISDFKILCKLINCKIETEFFLNSRGKILNKFFAKLANNLIAETGIFLLKNEDARD